MDAIFAAVCDAGSVEARLDALAAWKVRLFVARRAALCPAPAFQSLTPRSRLPRRTRWGATRRDSRARRQGRCWRRRTRRRVEARPRPDCPPPHSATTAQVAAEALAALRLSLQASTRSFADHLGALVPAICAQLAGAPAARTAARRLLQEGLAARALTQTALWAGLAPAWERPALQEQLLLLSAELLEGVSSPPPWLRDLLPYCAAGFDDPDAGVHRAAAAAVAAVARLLGGGGVLLAELAAAHVTPSPALAHMLEEAATASEPPAAPVRRVTGVAKPTRAVGGTLRTAPSARDAAAQAADAPRPLAAAISAADGLVHASPVHVSSERELAAETETLQAALAPSQEWDVRMGGLARLEGLVLGGAARMEGFALLLRALRDLLIAQMVDRRSSVVKQACHCVVVLAAAQGLEFEPLAEALLPALFGVVIISIKVMADAGVACVAEVLRHCPAPKLAFRCAEAARMDRNAKLRAACFEWLGVALDTWGSECNAGIERYAMSVEEALRCGVADADADARTLARRAAAAYARRWPDAFARLVARADGAAGRRLRAAAEDGGVAMGSAAPLAPLPRQSSCSVASTVAAARAMARAKSQRLPGFEAPVDIAVPPRGPGSSRPGYGAQLRSSVSDVSAYSSFAPAGADGTPLVLQAPPLGRRTSPPAAIVVPPLASRPRTAPHHGLPQQSPRPSFTPLTAATPTVPEASPWEWEGADGEALSVAEALSLLPLASTAASPTAWNTRAAAFTALRRALEASAAGGSDEAARALGDASSAAVARCCTAMAAGCDDAHARVAQCALEAIPPLSAAVPHVFGAPATLDALFTPCFARLVDSREAVRVAASAALAAISHAVPPAALLPPLGRALERASGARCRTGVLEFALHALLGADEGAGEAGELPPTPAHPPAAPAALRAWLLRVAPLASAHQPVALRNAALATLVAAFERLAGGEAALVSVLSEMAGSGGSPSAASSDSMALRRSLAPHLPALEAAISASRASRRAEAESEAAHAPTPSAAPSMRLNRPSFPPMSPSLRSPAAAAAAASRSFDAFSPSTPLPPSLALQPGAHPTSAARSTLTRTSPPAAVPARVAAPASVRRTASLPSPKAGAAAKAIELDALAVATEAVAAEASRILALLADGSLPADARAAALAATRRLASAAPPAAWMERGAQLLVAVIDALDGVGDAAIRTTACGALRELCIAAPGLCAEYAGLLAPRLLAAARDGETGTGGTVLAEAATAALEALCARLTPEMATEALSSALPKAGEPAAGADCARGVRALSASLQAAPPAALAAALPALLPVLFAAFSATAPDARKAAVFALVDLHLALGEELLPHLAPLSAAQTKLFHMYAERAHAAK